MKFPAKTASLGLTTCGVAGKIAVVKETSTTQTTWGKDKLRRSLVFYVYEICDTDHTYQLLIGKFLTYGAAKYAAMNCGTIDEKSLGYRTVISSDDAELNEILKDVKL